jgi:competence protein ComEA
MDVSSRLGLGVPLDLNQASAAELAQVPGITQTLAERIMAQRNRLGGFSKMEDLRAVKGIGPVTIKRLREYLTVGNKE